MQEDPRDAAALLQSRISMPNASALFTAEMRPSAPSLRESVDFYDLPMNWWKRVRTNNPLERFIRTLRQRLRPMGCFYDEPAIERAVFGRLLRTHKIKLTHNTRQYQYSSSP